MRIIAGTLRGRVLKSTQTSMLRPTTDRVRESIFNILAARIDFEGTRALDLFAGTGALGIEALSRGAFHCDFVESDRRAASVIGANLATLDLESRSRLIVRDAMKFIAATGDTYDLIFADPPYAAPIFERLVHDIVARNLLRPDGIFILERSSAMRLPQHEGLDLLLDRTFGDTSVAMWKKTESEIVNPES